MSNPDRPFGWRKRGGHGRAQLEWRPAGVATDSIYDMRTLLAGIPLGPNVRIDDDERCRAASDGAPHRRRRGCGAPAAAHALAGLV